MFHSSDDLIKASVGGGGETKYEKVPGALQEVNSFRMYLEFFHNFPMWAYLHVILMSHGISAEE